MVATRRTTLAPSASAVGTVPPVALGDDPNGGVGLLVVQLHRTRLQRLARIQLAGLDEGALGGLLVRLAAGEANPQRRLGRGLHAGDLLHCRDNAGQPLAGTLPGAVAVYVVRRATVRVHRTVQRYRDVVEVGIHRDQLDASAQVGPYHGVAPGMIRSTASCRSGSAEGATVSPLSTYRVMR